MIQYEPNSQQYITNNMIKCVLLISLLLCCAEAVIILKQVTIQNSIYATNVPYSTTFRKIPFFSFYIESGWISSPQFSLTYLANETNLTYSNMNITFVTLVNSNQFINQGYLNVKMLFTDQCDQTVNFGIVPLNIAASSLTFSGFSLNYPNSKMEIYPLAFPMSYTKIQNSTTLANNQIVLAIDQFPGSYMSEGKIYFSYIYFTNVYAANAVIALYQGFTQTINSYQFSYASFAFTPMEQNMLIVARTYVSMASPFYYFDAIRLLDSSGTDIDNFSIGYTTPPTGVFYTADTFIVSNQFNGCPLGNYLYYLVYYSTLPYTCIPCHISCLRCFPPNPTHPNITDSNSCLRCPVKRYLEKTTDSNITYGNCRCYRGMDQINGVCKQCTINCLSFKVMYIQTTNQSIFLLYFSYPQIVEKIPIDQNLVVKINGGNALNYTFEQTNDAVYTISLSLTDMAPCEATICSITFQYSIPQKVLSSDQTRVLSNSISTVKVQNFINYYNELPFQLQKAFEVLGIVMMGTYSSGYTSMFKILFELQQLIDAHKYLNLTLPIIYNQLVQQLQNFKFMDLTYLMPQEMRSRLISYIPVDLDQFGSAKLIYYEQGVNFAKNIITGFISLAFMLTINYIVYLLLKLTPLRLTRVLAKKISKRKIITIHDSLDQLVFPVFFFSITNFQYFLLHPSLYWIYAFAGLCGFLTIVSPFLVVTYVYLNKKNEKKVQIFEDLLQDNSMNQTVTYVYYVFNYYRKIFFALCLTDTLPGIVQIYLLICLNGVHLGFQLYLIIAKTYKSKSKVIVRLINSSCVIAVEALILVYNLSWYDKQTMINIGLSCFYLSVTTALLNIIDAFIKLFDTIFQEINEKKVAPAELEMFKQNPVQKQFSKQIICNLGQDLQPITITVKDPKQLKFHEDKQLMEQTFNRNGQEGSDISDQVSEAFGDKSQAEIELVFIDDEWTNVYPTEYDSHLLVERERRKNARKLSIKFSEESNQDLYQIPEEIYMEVEQLSKARNLKKHLDSKKQKDMDEIMEGETRGRRASTRSRNQIMQIKPIEETRRQDEELSEIS